MARRIGPRIRRLREARGLSLRELAERVSVSKNTLLRLEQGAPIAEKLVHRICDGLNTILPNLMVSDEDWNRPFRVHRADQANWRIAFRRAKAPSHFTDFGIVSDPCERHRIGNLGFVSGFLQNMDCSLRDGVLHAAMVELYGDQEKLAYRHSGEEFVMCLQGRMRLVLEDEPIILEQGDSVIFQSKYRHKYESDLPVRVDLPPTVMLMIWTESEEEPETTAPHPDCEH
jgi:transcriptional regulator with XRE-family HTH domain